MKLTFKTEGNLNIDYCVRTDNEDRRVERETVKVISLYGYDVVNDIAIIEKIEGNSREYLASMLDCRPDNVNVTYSSIDCVLSAYILILSGTFVFDIDVEDEMMVNGLPSDDEICENIKVLIYESIHEDEDFIEKHLLYSKVNDEFYDTVEVDFYYDYKSTSCEVNLEK